MERFENREPSTTESRTKGISLDDLADYYDIITPAEKSQFRRKQIGLVDLRQGEKVLEVGCGTGALSIPAKQAVGDSGEVMGLDITPKMIARAREKARKANLSINFHVASIDEVPFPDEYFHVVISSPQEIPLKEPAQNQTFPAQLPCPNGYPRAPAAC
jgi:ubiquinone/menaquinone biosynthesis C-methylase UbiE